MPISITCSSCHQRLKARDELAGRALPCPKCRTPIQIPKLEDDAALYLLKSEPASEPEVETPPRQIETEQVPAETTPQPSKRPKVSTRKDVASLPPLTTNDPPAWLRHLHWLLILALLPLAFSLLSERTEESFLHRLAKTLDEVPEEMQPRVFSLLDRIKAGSASINELWEVLPGQKLTGAFLARTSWAHWGFAMLAAILFMAFFLLLSSNQTAEPMRLLSIGFFTATIGILLLLLLQWIANSTRGLPIRGPIPLLVIFVVIKLIGFSYQAATDADTGLVLSFFGYTFGVGFCEEVCKALPLLWHYREPSDQNWRTAFLCGLASGAGFGIAKGIIYSANYYNGISGPGIYLVRFISCVALHALWTGSVAITLNQRQGLIQEEMNWYEYIPRILYIVAIPMVLHGLYDTLLKKDLNAYALGIAVLSFLYLAYQISHLHGNDDEAARAAMLREYKRRRAALQ